MHYARQGRLLTALDVRDDGEQTVVAVENAEKAIEILRYESVDFRVVDLNLDEIFEAYVVGRRSDPTTEAKAQAVLQPQLK